MNPLVGLTAVNDAAENAIPARCGQDGPVRTSDLDPVWDIRVVPYDHHDSRRLVAEVQQEYVVRYGGPDETPVQYAEFSPPQGLFVVLYDHGVPAAMGGWRMTGPGVAELKRMYVVPSHRGRGFARAVLRHLESSAAAAGAAQVVLETGTRQPEAIALYAASGYAPVPAFGHYADQPDSIHLGKPLTATESS